MPITKPPTRQQALQIMREKGHTYRSAAALIGVNHSHLYRVLTSNDRPSARTLSAVATLPKREVVAK